MIDRRPFEDVRPAENGFSIPEEKWRELLFIGAIRPQGGAFVRDPGRPLPPFRTPNLFPAGARFFPVSEAGRVRLRVELPAGTPSPEEPFLAGPRLALRLEAAEAAWAAALATALRRSDSGTEVACQETAGGIAVYLGSHSPWTRAQGLGMERSPSLPELEALTLFFQSRGCPPRITACPFAHSSLIGLAGVLGYAVAGFENVLFRCLGPQDGFSTETAGARVELVPRGKGDLWVRTWLTATGEAANVDSDRRLALALCDAGDPLLVCRGGQAAGVGAGFHHQRVALGFADATSPGFRRRGVEGALIEARLAHAVAAGCDLAMAVTEPGSPVQRNHERAGFRLAYTRVVLSRP